MCHVAGALILMLAAACGKAPGQASGGGASAAAGAFSIPSEWQEARGFEATPVGSEEPFLVYQSRDFQSLLVVPLVGEEAWVLDLAGKRVAGIPRRRLSITGEGAVVSSATATSRGTFTKTGADILFQAGDLDIRVGPFAPLTGEVPLETLLAKKKEYASAAADYVPDPGALARISGENRPLEIKAFFGTWCSSCRKYLPALIRSVEMAANPKVTVRYISVDENLSTPKDEIDRYKVHTTPTFIVLGDGGRELGRLEGIPQTTVEKDLAAILARSD
jgi:thiol-disulfide isomerase/thioredoxin